MKKESKVIAALAASVVLTLSSAITGLAATGWVQSGATWTYYKADGNLASNQWVKSGERWYWIEPNGVMATNKWVNNQEKWYYVDETGATAKGWKEISGKHYYFFEDFTMAVDTTIDSYRVGKDGVWVQ